MAFLHSNKFSQHCYDLYHAGEEAFKEFDNKNFFKGTLKS